MPALSATAAARNGSKCSSTTERWKPISAVGAVHTFQVGESGPKNPQSSRGRSFCGLHAFLALIALIC